MFCCLYCYVMSPFLQIDCGVWGRWPGNFLDFPQIPGLDWADVKSGTLGDLHCISSLFFNRVAPVCVYSSIRT